jgi:cell division protein FtsB
VSKKGEKQTKQKMILNGRVNLVIIVWYVVNSIFGKNGVNVASF